MVISGRQDGTIVVDGMHRAIAIVAIVLLGCRVDIPQETEPVTWSGGFQVLLQAEKPIGLVILHQGHASFESSHYPPGNLWPIADALVSSGYDVACFEMPPPEHGPPVDRFWRLVLDYIETVEIEIPIYMIGLSGGGWTTTVVTALSDRILRGYSVAGDVPIDMRARVGDWENENPPLPYRDLYTMAAPRLMHIYNEYDYCCLRYEGWTEEELGSPFVVDSTHSDHKISEWAIDWILYDINRSLKEDVWIK